jgi:hypothetical protein
LACGSRAPGLSRGGAIRPRARGCSEARPAPFGSGRADARGCHLGPHVADQLWRQCLQPDVAEPGDDVHVEDRRVALERVALEVGGGVAAPPDLRELGQGLAAVRGQRAATESLGALSSVSIASASFFLPTTFEWGRPCGSRQRTRHTVPVARWTFSMLIAQPRIARARGTPCGRSPWRVAPWRWGRRWCGSAAG